MTSTLSHNHNWVGFHHPWNSVIQWEIWYIPQSLQLSVTKFCIQVARHPLYFWMFFSQSLDMMEISSACWERYCCVIIFKVLSHLQSVLLPNTFSPPGLCSDLFSFYIPGVFLPLAGGDITVKLSRWSATRSTQGFHKTLILGLIGE